MDKNNKNLEPSPFHKKGGEGGHKRNWMGRTFYEQAPFGNNAARYGDDEWGIKGSQRNVEKAFGEFGDIDTETNLYAGAKNLMNIGDNFGGLENQFANLQNQYSENVYEDLTVNQQQAQFQAQQGNQQRADIMQGLKGSAGGSGAAGLAQALANQGQMQNQQISASIGQQEAANQKMKAQGRLQVQKGAADIDTARATGQTNIDMARAQAAQQTDIAMGQGAMEAQKFQLQGAADARDLTLQQKQGELSFLAGQVGANQSNKDTDTAGKSDRRLKKNITKIGESRSGLNVYSFEYKDSLDGKGLFQGVMSDEIPQEAVTKIDGYDRVNYSMLDVEFKQI
tara:strand:- start:11 stop:1027 length:1017 start_codon:yes stop_codon:yes gene_type:complete